ncbi:MAG: LysM domain-containing protein [Planctomycetota bacterium]
MLPSLPRFSLVAAAALAAGSLLVCSGCGSQAANAQNPPPQTLSEPVPAARPEPPPAPAIPVSSDTTDVAGQQRGESRALPAFVEPAPVPAPAAISAAAPQAAGPGSYHTLAKGETLYALSRKYNVKVAKIIAANQFKDPNHLAIGTKVYIPN